MNKKLVFLACLFLTLLASSIVTANEEYTDEDGNPVKLPDAKTAYSLENPGPWKKEVAFHDPVIKSRILVQGLEMTRVLKITIPHPMGQTAKGVKKLSIKAIFLVDKDGTVVGYHSFSADDSEAVYETKLNSVINYLEIFVECRQHGVWLKKVRLT